MSLIRAFVISFVFMLVAQGSLEAGQLFAPRDTIGSDPKTEDRTINNRLAICESRCRSERQDTLHFQKRAPQLSQLCLRECMKSKEEDVVTKNMRIRRDVVGEKRKQEKKENCLIPSLFLDHHSVKATVEVDFLERKPNLSISWKPVYTDPWYNWTSYAIFYQSGEGQPFCKLIPKDQHKFILADGEGWEYPSAIHMVIYTYPHSKESSHLMKTYPDPPARPLPTFPPTSSNDTIKIAVAASGAVFGLVLLAAFLFFIYRRRIRPCSLLYEGDRRQERYFMPPNNLVTIPAPGRPTPVALSTAPNAGPDSFYACYFPENEWFKLQVASVVNFFRNNGYPVEMDVMNSCELSSGPTRWAEQQIRRARNVLIFLSPGLLRLSGVDEDDPETHQEHERVWYELALLKKIFLQTHSASKMVCIALPNTNIKPQELPLWAELIYKWPEDEQKIFKRLNDKPIIQPWKC
ncbi:uncharacterized protein [Pocillopora verrucosa]|uniref:uncharacterized protein isoform X1 n=1 Tax=Pocillopora verrucosa TaxID=203993 RepID=UPI00333E7BF3